MLWLRLELITLGTLSLHYYARAHHYSMLMTFVSATTANNIEPNIQVHIINPVHVNKANWESLVYNNYCRMVRNCVHDAEGLI